MPGFKGGTAFGVALASKKLGLGFSSSTSAFGVMRWRIDLSVGVALLPLLLLLHFADGFQAPKSKCYALDKDYRLHDFTQWIGHELVQTTSNGDLTLRFCKDIQRRSNSGYLNFGRFVPALFETGQSTSFVQSYRAGDVSGCEQNGFDESGRSSHVSIVCGSCADPCQDSFGCICNSTSSNSGCRYNIVVAVKCGSPGTRVLKGFTVGFSPRGKEIVDNGITQWGYDTFHDDYSFSTEQRSVSLYFTAPVALSTSVKRPSYTVSPSKGLAVKLSGSAARGEAPTTESPTVLGVDMQCEKATGGPYSIEITVPTEGFDPMVFKLAKECEHKQASKKSSSGWATFGLLSFILLVLASCCCCLGFCYNTRVEHKHGLQAVPGISFLSRYLDSGSASDGYRQPQAAPDGPGPARPSSSKYGTV